MSPAGPDFQVNGGSEGTQVGPDVAVDSNGNYVAVWTADGNQPGVYFQRLNAEGHRVGLETRAYPASPAGLGHPSVDVDADGDFVVAWTSIAGEDGSGTAIGARRYDAQGQPLGETFQVNTTTLYSQHTPDVSMDAAGNFVIAWEGYVDGSPDVFAQRYRSDGTPLGTEFRVNSAVAGGQEAPAIEVFPDGSFVVAWHGEGPAPEKYNVYAQMYGADGAKRGGEFRVNTHVSDDQRFASLDSDPEGNFVIAWSSMSQDGNNWGVYFQKYDAGGTRVGLETRANAYTQSAQLYPAVAAVPDGEYLIAWQGQRTTGAYDIFARRIDASGVPTGGDLSVNTVAGSGMNAPAVAGAPSGGALVVWQGFPDGQGSGIGGRLFEAIDEAASVGGRVWIDAAANGLLDAQESGQDGVSVRLLDASGTLVSSVLTSGGGNYLFDNLVPRTDYVLEFVPPTGRVLTAHRVGSDRTIDSDPDPRTRRTAPFSLAPGQEDLTFGAGLVSPGRISGTVFRDNDDDGRLTTGEPGLAGWVLFIDQDGDGSRDAEEPSAVTDATGSFTFNGLLTGTYTLVLEQQDRWSQITDPATMTVALPPGAQHVVNVGVLTVPPRGAVGPVGPEVLLATETDKFDRLPAASVAPDGSYAVTWVAPAGNASGVFVQRFDAAGVAVGAATRANTSESGGEWSPAVATDAAGNFVVVWQSPLQNGIYARRYSSTGVASGAPFRVSTRDVGTRSDAAVAMNAGGSFLVAYRDSSADGSGSSVLAQRFSAAGTPVGSEFLVNTFTEGDQQNPSVSLDDAGNAVVIWTSTGQDDSGTGAYAQRYDPAGARVGEEFRVHSLTSGSQDAAGVAHGPDGGFVVAFTGSGFGGSGAHVRRFNAAGRPQGESVLAGPSGALAALDVGGAGEILVAWQAGNLGTQDIYARVFDAAGQAVGTVLRVNSTSAGAQTRPTVGMGNDGAAVVVWQGTAANASLGVYVQRYAGVGDEPGSVGDYVWSDTDGDGTQDAFEPGQAGVAVELYNDAGAIVATTLTLAGGAYRFDWLRPGQYRVRFVPPTSLVLTDADRGGNDATDSDADVATGRSPLFSVGPGQTVSSVDAGIVPPGSVSGTVFHDLDGDGARGPSEPALAGWIVYDDRNDNGQLDPDEASATSAPDGSYVLAKLNPGVHRVRLLPQERWAPTTGGAPDVTVPLGRDVKDVNFAQTTDVPESASQPRGSEFLVNTYRNDFQGASTIARDGEGNFVVVWQSARQDGSSSGIYAQRYAADATPVGGEFRVNALTAGDQFDADVAMNADGTFVVAWASQNDGDGYAVFARRFDASGVAHGEEFRVNVYTADDQNEPAVGIDDAGNFVVTWTSEGQDGSGLGVYARRFDADGVAVGGEFRVSVRTESDQRSPAVAMEPDGDFVVAFTDYRGSTSGAFDVTARRFSAAGAPSGPEFRVNTYTNGDQALGDVGVDALGNWVVTWWSQGQDGSEGGIYAQRFNASGVRQGSEFRVNTTTQGDQREPSVGIGSDGDFVVAWSSLDGSDWGVFGQRYDAAGLARGGQFRANEQTALGQYDASVSVVPDGFVISWTGGSKDGSNFGVVARAYETFTAPGVVGDRVWLDTDADGIQDAGEAGQGNVTVRLFRAADGLLMDTTATAADGSYRFTGVKPGVSYFLEFVSPFGQAFTLRDQGADDARDSDVSLGGRSGVFTVAARQRELRIDAGLVPAAKVRGVVFNDHDADGTRDVGEEGLPGWVLFIDEDGDGTRGASEFTAVSGQDGVYSFSPLGPGTFRLVQLPQNLWTRTTPDGVLSVTVPAGQQDVSGPDVGNHTDVPDLAPAPEGPSSRVDTATEGEQHAPDVAAFDDGSYVVAWYGRSANDIRVQLFDATGARVGTETRVNLGGGSRPAIATDGVGGGFVVVWGGTEPGSPGGVYARRFTAAGVAVGNPFRVTESTSTYVQHVDVAMNAAGEFVVTWSRPDQEGPGIYARRFDGAGVARGGEFPVNTMTLGDQVMPTVALDDAGNTYFAWVSEDTPAAIAGVYGRALTADGTPRGPEVLVAPYAGKPSASMNGRGEMVLAWQDGGGIFAMRFDQFGVAQGAPRRADTTATGAKENAVVSLADDGGFVVIWQERTQGQEGRWGDYGRIFNPAGLAHGDEFRISSTDRDPQFKPSVAMSASGSFVAAWGDWEGTHHVFAQRYGRFAAPASVGDRVWNDLDGDGIQDEGEPGIDGVTVGLFTDDGLPRGSVVSANGGFYRFDDLRPGRGYYLEFVAPTDYIPTAPGVGGDRSRDSDVVDAGRTAVFTPSGGLTKTDVDAGMVRRATISGTKYHDRDADGVRDVGEEGLEGWTVYLDSDGDGRLDASEKWTLTGPNGGFAFTDLRPGQYRVAEVGQDRWSLTTPSAQLVTNVVPGQVSAGLDLGNHTPIEVTTVVPLGPAEPVATNRVPHEEGPVVSSDDRGNYVVVWQADGAEGQDIFAQRYDASGQRVGAPFRVNMTVAGNQTRPSVTMNGDGDFVVVWQQSFIGPSSYPDVYGQRFNADGSRSGSEFRVNPLTTRESHTHPGVAIDEDGDFVVEWNRTIYGDAGSRTYNVYAQRYNRVGERQGGDVFVARLPAHQSGAKASDIAMDGDGDFVITWHQGDGIGDGDLFGVFARRYAADGTPLGDAFVVNTLTQYDQYMPSVAMDGDGNFVVSWEDMNPNGRLLYAQRFASDGSRQGGQFLVDHSPERSKVVMDRNTGDFLLAWAGSTAAYVRHYAAAGLPQGETVVLGAYHSYQHYRASAAFTPDGFVATWTAYGGDSTGWDAMARRYADVVTSPLATSGDDAFYVRLGAGGDAVEVHRGAGPQPAPAYVLPRSLLPTLDFTGLGGNDTVIIDLANGDPTPPGGISFDGGDGNDRFVLLGSNGNDDVTIGGLSATGGSSVRVGSSEAVEFDGRGGTDHLSVTGSTTVSFIGDTAVVGTLNIGPDATVALGAAGTTLRVSNLTVSSTGRLEVGSGGLTIVNGDLAGIEARVAAARNGGDAGRWTGHGIAPALSTIPTRGLAVFRTGADVGVRLTYNGDANGDGRINSDDYFRIDSGFLAQPATPTYAQGDFNYDNQINSDDYFLIDSAFLAQGTPLTGAPATAGALATDVISVAAEPQTAVQKRTVRSIFSDEPVTVLGPSRRMDVARRR